VTTHEPRSPPETDATFLAMLQGQPSTARASELEVARYKK
jgi:hypothetical protein